MRSRKSGASTREIALRSQELDRLREELQANKECYDAKERRYYRRRSDVREHLTEMWWRRTKKQERLAEMQKRLAKMQKSLAEMQEPAPRRFLRSRGALQGVPEAELAWRPPRTQGRAERRDRAALPAFPGRAGRANSRGAPCVPRARRRANSRGAP